jgi:DNA-directed RNA polymerase specialized sigma24 family protein
MKVLGQTKRVVADLQWLATLLTGNPDTAADLTVEAIASTAEGDTFFSSWMLAWARRLFIGKALAAVREELAASIRRTSLQREKSPAGLPRSWTLDRRAGKSDLERALLPIDLFPRAAVLLLLFERVPLADAAVLLDADPELVRKAQAAGVAELTINLARIQGWQSAEATPVQLAEGPQHA